MPVKTRNNAFVVDFVWKGKRLRKGGFPSQTEALQWEYQTLADLNAGKSPATVTTSTSSTITLKELARQVYESCWKGKKAEESLVGNGDMVVKMLGEDRLASTITLTSVDAMVAELERKGNSNGTINRKLAALSKLLNFAWERGYIGKPPPLKRRREAEHRLRWLTREEEETLRCLLLRTGRTQMHDLVITLLDTGLRLNEALELQPQDVLDGVVRVWVSKNGKPRSVPMTERVKALMEARVKAMPQDAEKIFHDLDYWSAQYQWKWVRSHLKLEHDTQYVLHMLRHTFCSRLAQAGVPIQVIQQLAGHKSIQVTMRYAHLSADNLLAAIGTLGQYSPTVS